MLGFCPKWRLAVGVGANGGKCQRERGGTDASSAGLSEAENHLKNRCKSATTLRLKVRATLAAALAATGAPQGGLGRPSSSGHARAAAEMAGCRLGSRRSRGRARLELRRRARAAAEDAHRQGRSPPGRSLGRLVGRSVGSGRAFDFLCWCALSGVVCAGWGSGFPCPRILDSYGRSAFVRVSSSVIDAVCACLLARLLRRVGPCFSRPGPFVCLVLARAWCGIAGGSTRLLAVITHHARAASARGALCACFGGWGCGAS